MTRMFWNRPGTAPQDNLTEEPLTAMITEIRLVGESNGWWVDIGVSLHVCYDRDIFTIYTVADDQKVCCEILAPLKL